MTHVPVLKKCSGPCGRELHVRLFPVSEGRRRPVCGECFNKRRRDLASGAVQPFNIKPARPGEAPFNINVYHDGGTLPETTVQGGGRYALPPDIRGVEFRRYEPVIEVAAPPAEPEKITAVEEHRLKVKVAQQAAQIKQLTAELSDAQLMQDVVESARAVHVDPIAPRERTSGLLEGTCQVLASDWHIEEEVRPEQVAGRNRYNLDISRRRMERFFEATRWGLGFNRQAFKIRDLILWLGGDLITNYLHPDNVETNLLSPPEAIAYAHSSIVTGIKYLLLDDELERIVVPCNDGNHGRMTEKMRSASRTAMSLEIMLYGMIAREFAHEPRVQFIIAQGSHLYYDVYGRTIRYTHGDETKYGGGVGGVTIPIYRAMARWQTVRHADLTCMGHYHQRTSLNDLIINGSLIGYSPYSLSIGARMEAPAQDLTMLDPKRFKSISMPLHVADRDDDDAE